MSSAARRPRHRQILRLQISVAERLSYIGEPLCDSLDMKSNLLRNTHNPVRTTHEMGTLEANPMDSRRLTTESRAKDTRDST